LNFRQCSSTGKTPTTTDDKSLIPNNEKTDSNKPAAVKNSSNVPTVSTPPKKEVVIPHWTKCHIAKHKTKEELMKVPFTSTLTSHYKNPQNLVKIPYVKPFESTYEAARPYGGRGSVDRIVDQLKPRHKQKTKYYIEGLEAHYDMIVIGGGAIGCSVAFWLMQRVTEGFKILVVERDPQYTYASTTMSVGGLRQQFSLPENIEMSLFGADFLRNASRILHCEDVYTPDVNFQPHGYLFLASEEGVETMRENHYVQIECGAKVELLSAKQLKRKFPWLNTDGIAMGSYGYENEGWFDPWALLTGLKMKCKDLGVHFVEGEVYNIAHEVNEQKIWEDTIEDEIEDETLRLQKPAREVHVHLPNGDVFPFDTCHIIIAAGAESGSIANLAGMGIGKKHLQVPLPVEPRKRYVYNVHCPDGPGLDCPLVVDPSGTYFRREGLGNHYLCGRSPANDSEEPDITTNDVDYDFFDEKVWPNLANRAKCFENIKIKSAWSGFYDYNTYDQNAIIGQHPLINNVWFATGCSGHGIQQAPAIGRAIMELILDHGYHTINLNRFQYERVLNDEPIFERNIV